MTQSQVVGNLTLKTATQMSAANCIIIIFATKLCIVLFVFVFFWVFFISLLTSLSHLSMFPIVIPASKRFIIPRGRVYLPVSLINTHCPQYLFHGESDIYMQTALKQLKLVKYCIIGVGSYNST